MADGARSKKRRGKGPRSSADSRVVAPRGPGRKAPRETPFELALGAVGRFLETLAEPSAVIGGVAVIAWGRARNTTDIDAAVSATPETAQALIKRARSFDLEPRIPSAAAFAQESMVLLLQHTPTSIPVDLSFAQLEFERRALEAAVVRQFGSVSIRVPNANALIVYKMVASRPKDLEDVDDLLLRGLEIDSKQILATLRSFDELLDTDRAGDFGSVLARIRKDRPAASPKSKR